VPRPNKENCQKQRLKVTTNSVTHYTAMFGKILQTLLTVAEVPVLYDPRAESQSELKLNMSVIQRTFIESFKAQWLKVKRLKVAYWAFLRHCSL
jgi:hypothetical protein